MLRSLQELVGAEQILFASDFPFAPEPLVGATVAGLVGYAGFEEGARRAIERDNALRLLPRHARRLGLEGGEAGETPRVRERAASLRPRAPASFRGWHERSPS